jgi:hypothetical protein
MTKDFMLGPPDWMTYLIGFAMLAAGCLHLYNNEMIGIAYMYWAHMMITNWGEG